MARTRSVRRRRLTRAARPTSKKLLTAGNSHMPVRTRSAGECVMKERVLLVRFSLAEDLEIHHKTVLIYVKIVGYTKKFDTRIPPELTKRNLMHRVLVCDSLLKRNETEPCLKRLITGDEKWITYDKKLRKRSWSKGKLALQTRKTDWEDIIHYEILAPGKTINSDLYCQLLMNSN
ncbi:Histone-lysine N-methyltransferase SETMAR [Eumeta japonica]|uniref:Histone-lysine N-methyltransferase SETMAR n=1 Tax=Eumeta variegata TaxID=151549 RepID=A0A4C1YDH4_EUMVA|nr:Histone-lysine N-methyltransferase SETMAR [Eumeta japonica]